MIRWIMLAFHQDRAALSDRWQREAIASDRMLL
jgi:hypothetical protein